MNDEDPTKDLPGVPDTEPTMHTVMERLNAMQETMDRRQDIADRRHTEIQESFRKLGDKMDILNHRALESDANQV